MNETQARCIVLYAGSVAAAGGAERLLWEEERYLTERGYDVTVLVTDVTEAGLMGYTPARLVQVPAEGSRTGRLRSLRHSLSGLAPDLVVAQSNRGAIGLFLAMWPRHLPYIVHIHGTMFWFPEDNLKYSLLHRRVFDGIRESVAGHREFIPSVRRLGPTSRVKMEAEALVDYVAVRKARAIVTLTDQLRWEIRQLYGREAVVARGCLSPEAMAHVPARDIRADLALTDREVILSVGRLDVRKRIDVLIAAMPLILQHHPAATLLIGGTGEDEPRLSALVKSLHVETAVRFLGFIPETDLADHYAAADVFAFPSWTTSGITTYEALASGAKVVWTSEADEPILTDPHVFVADPTPESFATATAHALESKVTGKPNLELYTWKHYFDTVYETAIVPHLPASPGAEGHGQTRGQSVSGRAWTGA
ncbi:MAG: glycosyltransferase family 4 protein [Dehalococcoidia bacterium]|jgi:glycosyltransferase involved in cell wall biosynthesis|nr:glycosyltransferase family 4 protein [Dehalococcoidia bacterium]